MKPRSNGFSIPETTPMSWASQPGSTAGHAADTATAAEETRANKLVRVAIADLEPIYLQGLRSVLDRARGVEIVAEARDASRLLADVAERRPDVAVVSSDLSPAEGFSIIGTLRETLPSCRCLVLATQRWPHWVRLAMDAGAHGYLLRDVEPSRLASAVVEVHEGSTVTPHKDEFERSANNESGTALTPRESEVLRLLAAGNRDRDIARLLGISVHTVGTHRASIRRKTGLRSQAALVAFAIRHFGNPSVER
jgi:DNA-binding NarL/FixJ family response regulator